MVDSAIAILLGVLLVEMARFGGHVSANPPATPEVARRYTWRFRIYAFLAVLLTVAQGARIYFAGKDAESSKAKLNNSIETLQHQVQASDTGRQVDNAYLKAKLEDYKELQQLAPALLTMAQATEGYTQKQYESSVMNKKQLLDMTTKTVTQIRSLGSKCKATEEGIFSAAYSASPNPSMTRDQRIQWFEQRRQIEEQTDEQNRQSCEQNYRQQIMGDAAFLRRELLSRIGGDSFLLPLEKTKYIAIDGIFAGPDPIDDSADYLEALANRLKQQAPRQP
jgi:hypothetical protein